MGWYVLCCAYENMCTPWAWSKMPKDNKLETNVFLQSQVYLKIGGNNIHNKTNMNILRSRKKNPLLFLGQRIKLQSHSVLVVGCFRWHSWEPWRDMLSLLCFMSISLGKNSEMQWNLWKFFLIYKHFAMLLLLIFKAEGNEYKKRLKWHVREDKGKQHYDLRLITEEFTVGTLLGDRCIIVFCFVIF